MSQAADIIDALLDAGITDQLGCGVKPTLYVSIKYTDYVVVHRLWAAGVEVAAHTITVSGVPRWRKSATRVWRRLTPPARHTRPSARHRVRHTGRRVAT